MLFGKKFYYDDPEGDALDKKTTHPNFVKICTEEFYYDCIDDFSPFGNDDGAEALSSLEEWYQETRGKGNVIAWMFEMFDEYGFEYSSSDVARVDDLDQILEIEEEAPSMIDCLDNTIIGMGFGQVKITGHLDSELATLAYTSILRQEQITRNRMNTDETRFLDTKEEYHKLSEEYLQRLEIYRKDLKRLEAL